MRFSIVFALAAAVAQASAMHVARTPQRSRHAAVARELAGEGPKTARNASSLSLGRRSSLRRSGRCTAKTSATTASESSSTAVNVGSNPSSTSTSQSTSTSATETSSESGNTATQAGAIPSATRATASDPYLTSLSSPVSYNKIPAFTATHTGDLTFYDQGLTACGDTYDDSTYTAAISHIMYDAWPGADFSATNLNTVCGTFVKGRYYITNSDEVVSGNSHAIMGGDGILQCYSGEQCHCPLTATVHNPENGVSVTVSIVDRCEGCSEGDIDLSPAPFLALTRPDLDQSTLALGDFLTEALKDPEGRHYNITWSFDTNQKFACSVRST